MKTIGLIGGTGWISTVEYYRIINETINHQLGGLHFARCILFSLDYGEVDALNQKDDMQGIFKLLAEASAILIKAGVDFLVLCANTMHLFADELEKTIDIPLIHIAEATAKHIKKQGITKTGLLGTKYTMEQDFYKKRLKTNGIDVLIPEEADREFIHSTIMNELLKSNFKKETKRKYIEIINNLKESGADGIVLGCTEIPLLINQDDIDVPLFNTLKIHAVEAAYYSLAD